MMDNRRWREGPSQSGLYLNVGCGPDGPEKWINIDRSPHLLLDRYPPLKWMLRRGKVLSDAHMTIWPRHIVYGDICRGLPLPDACADAIYSSHMLEHLYLDEARRALLEFRRLLSPEGVLRLALPDTEKLATAFLSRLQEGGAQATLDFNDGLNAHPLIRPTGRRRLTHQFGASIHRWQPTRQLVTEMLTSSGLGHVMECDFHRGALPDLASVEHREESFFLEATPLAIDDE